MVVRQAMNPRPHFDLELRGRRISLGERTLILGVLNVTPDSFSDGGLYLEPRAALAHAARLIEAGADWIDIGGESTRPGSTPVTPQEELARVLPVIRALHQQFPSVPLSIDTTKAEVAEAAVRAGASIINDVSGLRLDPRLAEVARRYRTALILMHLRGRPETMQRGPFARDIWRSVRQGLARSVRRALAAGVRRSQLILDPGLGFGKTREQNFTILAHLERLRRFRLPILIGTSRKSFVQAVARGEGNSPSRLHQPAARRELWPIRPGAQAVTASADPDAVRRLEIADAACVTGAILGGAHLVRVHDVSSLKPAVRLADLLLRQQARSSRAGRRDLKA